MVRPSTTRAYSVSKLFLFFRFSSRRSRLWQKCLTAQLTRFTMPRRAVAERPMVGEREKKLDHFFWRLLLQKGGKNILLPPRLFHLLLASSHSLHSANSSDMKNVQSFLQLSILETTIPASGTAVSGVRVHIYQFKNQVASHLLDFQLECNSNAKTVERNAIRSDIGPAGCNRKHL